jgi:cell division protein FtsN
MAPAVPQAPAGVLGPDGNPIRISEAEYQAFLKAITEPAPAAPASPPAQQSVNELTVISGTTNVVGTGSTNISLPAGSIPAAAPSPPPASTVKPVSAPAKTVPATTAQAVSLPKSTAGQWWVQVGAYTSKKSADSARAALASSRVPGEVFTYTANANTPNEKIYYRVRVGPYATQSEAERIRENLDIRESIVLKS